MTTTPFKIGLGEIEVRHIDHNHSELSLIINFNCSVDEINDEKVKEIINKSATYLRQEGFISFSSKEYWCCNTGIICKNHD